MPRRGTCIAFGQLQRCFRSYLFLAFFFFWLPQLRARFEAEFLGLTQCHVIHVKAETNKQRVIGCGNRVTNMLPHSVASTGAFAS